MKINEPQRIGAINPYQRQNEQKFTEVSPKKKRDNLEISPEAMEMLQSQNIKNNDRLERIDSLKQQVQTGTYHVEANRIAEKLLPYMKRHTE